MEYINKIKKEIVNGLPGAKAHREMLSAIRENQMMKFASSSSPMDAAVLILLYKKGDDWHIPFIKRAEDKYAHSGQISLPGGKSETYDTNLQHTALRETEEEIGISQRDIELIGNLTSLYIPPSNFNVAPFAGIFTGKEIKFIPEKSEVDYVIEISVKELMNPQNLTCRDFNVKDLHFSTPCFNIRGDIIWGATAMIINEFLSITNKQIL